MRRVRHKRKAGIIQFCTDEYLVEWLKIPLTQRMKWLEEFLIMSDKILTDREKKIMQEIKEYPIRFHS